MAFINFFEKKSSKIKSLTELDNSKSMLGFAISVKDLIVDFSYTLLKGLICFFTNKNET